MMPEMEPQWREIISEICDQVRAAYGAEESADQSLALERFVSGLSRQEAAILLLVLEGSKYREIAGQLGLSLSVVKARGAALTAKIEESDAWKAVSMALGKPKRLGEIQSETAIVHEVVSRIERDISLAASVLGRKGGSVKSERKTAAVRENGKLGGRAPRLLPGNAKRLGSLAQPGQNPA